MNLQKEILIFIGSPGVGKGSIAHLCIKEFGWTQLSTGNLFRKHIAEQTSIGKEIDFAIKSGKLVSDSLVIKIVDDWFFSNINAVNNVILDGYPRTLEQARALYELLTTKFYSLKLRIVHFFASDNTVIKRLSNRYICQNINCQFVYSIDSNSGLMPNGHMRCDKCDNTIGRRADDEKDVIERRLRVYHKYEEELLQYYKTIGIDIVKVNVEKPLQEVFSSFKDLLITVYDT